MDVAVVDVTHWFVDCCFEALSLDFAKSPSCFLEPEVIIYGKEGGAELVVAD